MNCRALLISLPDAPASSDARQDMCRRLVQHLQNSSRYRLNCQHGIERTIRAPSLNLPNPAAWSSAVYSAKVRSLPSVQSSMFTIVNWPSVGRICRRRAASLRSASRRPPASLCRSWSEVCGSCPRSNHGQYGRERRDRFRKRIGEENRLPPLLCGSQPRMLELARLPWAQTPGKSNTTARNNG